MPIVTLMERSTRFPRLGVVRLGVKEVNARGKEYPREVPYFVLPADLRDHLPNPKPTELRVAFPVNDMGAIFDPWYKLYQGPFLKLKCDGRTAQVFRGGKFIEEGCRLPEGETVCPCGAKPQGRLHVLVDGAPNLGIYQVLIGGHERIAGLTKEIHLAQRVFGSLTHDHAGKVLWFTLRRIESITQAVKPDGEHVTQRGYPVHLICEVPTGFALGPGTIAPHPLALVAAPPLGATTETIEDEGEAPDDEIPAKPVSDLGPLVRLAGNIGISEALFLGYVNAVWPEGVSEASALDLQALFDEVRSPQAAQQLTRAMEAKVLKARRPGVKHG